MMSIAAAATVHRFGMGSLNPVRVTTGKLPAGCQQMGLIAVGRHWFQRLTDGADDHIDLLAIGKALGHVVDAHAIALNDGDLSALDGGGHVGVPVKALGGAEEEGDRVGRRGNEVAQEVVADVARGAKEDCVHGDGGGVVGVGVWRARVVAVGVAGRASVVACCCC